MVAWKRSFRGRFVQSFRLLWRTALLQLLLGLGVLLVMAGFLALIVVTTKYAAGWLPVVMPVSGVGLLLLTFFPPSVVLSGMVTAMAGEGQVASVAACSAAWRRLPLLANTSLLVVLCAMPLVAAMGLAATVFPLIILLFIPFAIWLGARLYTLPAVLMMEDCNPWQAIRRAWQLSRGSCWRVLGNGLLIGVVFLLLWLTMFVLVMVLFAGGIAGVMTAFTHGGGMSPLMGMAASAGAGLAGLLVFAMVTLQMIGMMVMLAFALIFYAEQRQDADESVARWQAGPPVSRLQWLLFWGLVVLLSLGEAMGSFDVPGFRLNGGQQSTTVTQRHSQHRSGSPHHPRATVQKAEPKPGHHVSLEEQRVAVYQALQQGDLVRARKQLENVVQRYPDDVWAMQAEGWLLYRSGKRNQAVKMMARACRGGMPSACLLARGGKQ